MNIYQKVREAMFQKCPNCGSVNSNDLDLCDKCGAYTGPRKEDKEQEEKQ